MEIKRKMFVDSVSSTAVQLRRHPNHPPFPDSDPGIALHQVNIITGNAAAANADTGFWLTGCFLYEVTIKRVG